MTNPLADKPTIALIVAAGSSSRMEADVPKPYMQLAGQMVLRYSLETFCNHPAIDGVRVVISRAHHPLYKKAASGFSLFPPVIGGDRRQDSVRIGLDAIARVNPGKVLIHDAARPLVDAELIDRVLAGLDEAPAVLPYLPVVDSIHQQQGEALTPLNRSELVSAQTPQGFDFDAIYAAHKQFADGEVTDDIALAKKAGLKVSLALGSERNIKLTTKEQLTYLSYMTQPQATAQHSDEIDIRTGLGFDVHAFEEHAEGAEQVVHLCGLAIPHTHKLKGHSDADVALHAVVDALLGAVGEGDIGEHFPPSDPKWKGANSKQFVQHACEILKTKKAVLQNIDVTIIGECPKVSEHRTAMRQQLAGLLGCDVTRVSVKATTTEKLGFLGRKEGLAAQAIATVKVVK